ncbi:MAG: hypothetical protein LBV80_08010 [Deltaproteobacteria bacterium]|jgi:hypothetical protein|nr:hypothetical protein [Deltaproteobacteria bacterium]
MIDTYEQQAKAWKCMRDLETYARRRGFKYPLALRPLAWLLNAIGDWWFRK